MPLIDSKSDQTHKMEEMGKMQSLILPLATELAHTWETGSKTGWSFLL